MREGDAAAHDAASPASRIGIVGMGRIGRVIAEKLKVFHCEIAYFARHKRPTCPIAYYADLVALARDSLALIVIVPGGEATEKLIDRRVMDALGPEGILINVARGSVVDEPALVAALQEGRLGGAGARRLRRRAERARGAVRDGECRAAAAPGQRDGRDAPGDGRPVLANLAAHFAGRPPPSPLS